MEYEIHADAAIQKVRPMIFDLMNHGYSEDDAKKFLYKCLGVFMNDLSLSERIFINLYLMQINEEKDNA